MVEKRRWWRSDDGEAVMGGVEGVMGHLLTAHPVSLRSPGFAMLTQSRCARLGSSALVRRQYDQN